MNTKFRIGLTPDFYEDAKGMFERPVEAQFSGLGHIEYGQMPPQPGKIGTPDALNQFDGIVALSLKITGESLAGVDRLAVIARWGVGYDMIDVPALTEAGIALCITPSGVRRPVAEAILTLVFALLKNMFPLDRMTRAGRWRSGMKGLGRDIPGHVLGSVGCGNIARELFRLAGGLGFKRMIACDPAVSQREVDNLGVELVDMDTLFRESDIVSVNTLLSSQTEGLIGEEHFRLMKPSAYFINTARGPIVRHSALVKALRENWIAGAGIDVFPTEPAPADDPLFECDNVIVAPHALAWTEGCMYDNGTEACQHVIEVSRGEVPGGVVNREVLERPNFLRKLERYR